ncbi:MAG TPA: AarF/ABC1/UbiB kinase family protein [Polyangiales bacterium]|nr:AarF/ABC1/UbiB kinase family protein [Polyangiales bacterium]
MSDERKVPTGRLARVTRMARVGVRTGLSVLGGGDGSAAALQAVELLGNLRGIAAKVGQMASYIDGFIPEPQRVAYERVLAGLQTATVASPFAEVRGVLEAELGSSLEQAFAELDEVPIASASIGQVHRARLHDGRAVAVKVQHPGIDLAIEADLKSAGAMTSVVSLLGPRSLNPQAVFDEVAERFREELDYQHEAAQQTAFAAMHAGDPRVIVPAVIASHSTKRVLCTELAVGQSFAEVLHAPASLRRTYAELLWHFVFKGLLVHGRFNADPHPGNFIFHPDGRITFLDFGCIQTLSPEQTRGAHEMHASTIAGDQARFMRAAAFMSGTQPGPYERDLLAYLWRCYEPLKHSPFHMTAEYVTGVVHGIQELKGHMLRKSSNVTPIPRGLVFTNRLQFGFYSVLARLNVDADYVSVARELLKLTP